MNQHNATHQHKNTKHRKQLKPSTPTPNLKKLHTHPCLTQHEHNMTTQNTYTIISSNTTNNNASETYTNTNDQETAQPTISEETESKQDKQEARKLTNESSLPGTNTQRRTTIKTTSRTGRKRVPGKQRPHNIYTKHMKNNQTIGLTCNTWMTMPSSLHTQH